MKVSKWVDFGQEVDVHINFNDIAAVIGEAWDHVNGRFEDGPTSNDVICAMSNSLRLFKALKDEHIADLTTEQRSTIAKILAETAERFQIGGLFKNVSDGASQSLSGNAGER